MKLVVVVKDDFAIPDKSKVIAYFGFFRTIKILMRGKNQRFDLSIDFHDFQVFGRDNMEDTKLLVMEN